MGAGLAVAGSLLGSFLLFYLARRGGDQFLGNYTASGRGAVLRRWFEQYGMLTVFIPALLPIPLPLKIPVLCAGALGVHPAMFAGTLALARLIRYYGLAWLGTKLGADTIPFLKHHVVELLIFSAVLFVVLFLLVRYVHHRRNRLQPASSGE
ncbi:MAG TPA: VTT domain-containing protein [Bryobacteraceae bacterium]|nr:VTT domain-containing protein [Bryobacteraceae bacterium]